MFLVLRIEKFLRAPFLEIICVQLLLKMCSWNWERVKFIGTFNFTLKSQDQYSTSLWKKWKCLFLLDDVSTSCFHEVCIHIQYFFCVARNKLTLTIPTVNQKKIKSSGKEYVMWTCFKFWPMKNIFWKLQANQSLIMACLKITENYQIYWLFCEFIQT